MRIIAALCELGGREAVTIKNGKVILITGASSGIGKACALYLAQQGHQVYGTSRHLRDSEAGVTMLKMDVTDDISVQTGVERIVAEAGRIDVVVNNAGFGYGGALENTSIEEARATMETNFMGTLRVCRMVLPLMRAKKSGLIVNVSSIGGLMGLPFQGLYSASKYAVEGLTEALRMEVRRFGIQVVLLEPGDIHTSFTANRRSTQETDADLVYREQYLSALAKIEADEKGGPPPQIAALLLARIVNAPRPRARYVVGPFYEKLAILVKRLVPHALFEWIIMQNYGLL